MGIDIIIKEGTSKQLSNYIPKTGEPIFVTDQKHLRIGDGVTYGGQLVGGTALFLKDGDPLPKLPSRWKSWLITKLGGHSDTTVVHYPDSKTTYILVDGQWELTVDKHIIVAGNIDKLMGEMISRLWK